MVNKAEKLAQLAKAAKLLSDMELRKFAAFRQNMQVLAQQGGQIQGQLDRVSGRAVHSLADLREVMGATQRLTLAQIQTQAEIARLTPRFEAMRSQSARAFGRAEVLRQMAEAERGQRKG
ncbi:MAG: hypothetical protein Q4G24_09425 [Paracoccus sp. (in: a-proteobacteria)]|uniref:hypothetical protein n=1 Tax=Paracoccus sp. TaxID=267 RepID=UPI0026DFE4FA|nr:hypothetical protein [Paracoccus sp. (in: a-proteobacteria)]MDO5621676.1 hypothetical protein [Paracoccus sp. (in: a-proteobacteria)]